LPCPIALAAALSVAAPAAQSDANPRVLHLLRDAGARGAIVVLDVPSGAVVASVGNGRDVAAPVLPLSVVKLYVAAMWWDRGLGEAGIEEKAIGTTVEDVIARGGDRAGAKMAEVLRELFGATSVLDTLKDYGLGAPPGSLALDPGLDDAAWGSALSTGERDIRVTLLQVARFVRIIGAGGEKLLRPETAKSLQTAMLASGTRGTAKAAAARLAGTPWRLGGKTGTGPNVVGPTSDGWFAGLLFEGTAPRYAFAVYVDGRGPGGGVAASLAADLPKVLAR